MGDSDDDYNGRNQMSNLNNNGHMMGGGGNLLASSSSSSSMLAASNAAVDSIKKNRDKFYRERDETNGNNNGNGNPMRRSGGEWNDSRSRSEWKTSSRGGGGGGNYSSSGGYGGSNRMNSSSSVDYRSKYSGSGGSPSHGHHHSYESRGSTSPPPPHKRSRTSGGGATDAHYSSSSSSYNKSSFHRNPASGGGGYIGNARTGVISMLDQQHAEPDYPTQPPMMSFKHFLQVQDDNISDEDAIKLYNEYKIEFKRTQINNFFLEHKEEDWFKQKYHPDENYKRRSEQNRCILNRLDVFMDLMNKGWLDNQQQIDGVVTSSSNAETSSSSLSVEFDRAKDLTRFLDAFVIKLENGTDDDIKQLLYSSHSTTTSSAVETQNDDVKEIKKSKNRSKSDQYSDKSDDSSSESSQSSDTNSLNSNESAKKKKSRKHKQKRVKTTEDNEQANGQEEEGEDGEEKQESKKRKSSKKSDSDSESGAYTDSDLDSKKENGHSKNGNSIKKVKTDSNPTQLKQLHRTSSIFMRNLAPSVTKQDLESLCRNYEGFKRVALSDPAPERGFFRRGWISFESNVDVKKICWSLQNIKIKDFNPGAIVNRELTNRVRPINYLVSHHKQAVKNDIKLAMKIIQNMDKRWNLWQDESETTVQNGSEKHAENDANKAESGVSAGEEPSTKIESNTDSAKTSSDNPTASTSAATNENANLEEQAFSPLPSPGPTYIEHKYTGTNPLLVNITDYLVDETNAEEEELLSNEQNIESSTNTTTSNSNQNQFDIDIDKTYTAVLDKLILYLRLVHSIDFYNALEYHQEDSMPNRCGIMFVRPALPLNAAPCSLKITQNECAQYMQQFEAKLKPFIEYKERIDVDLAKKLGVKSRVEEIEKFIKTNTQELATDRWLCPLSGKRFKGPEFIRKHLFYKHMEKIVEVKKEVEYFSNYVYDPKRPQLPEHPSNRSAQQQQSSSGVNISALSNSISNQGSNYNQTSYQSQFANISNQAGYTSSASGMMMGGGMNQMQQQYSNRYAGGGGGWNNPSGGYQMADSMMPYQQQQQQAGYGYNQSGYGFNQGFKKPGFGNMGYTGASGPRRGDSRELIQYKDLDAPEDR